MDGWSNLRNEHLNNITCSCNQKDIFYNAYPSDEFDAVYLASQAMETIEEIGPQRISGFTTDNASVMGLMKEIIGTTYPSIVFIGCAAHAINLLLGDWAKLDGISSFISDCKEIVKTVKRSAIFSNQFAECCARVEDELESLKMIGATRWGSSADMMRSILVNEGTLKVNLLMIIGLIRHYTRKGI